MGDPVRSTSRGLGFLDEELASLDAQHLLRRPIARGDACNLCSNDYLGYARRAQEAAPPSLAGLAAGAGASRLVSGEASMHLELEADLARWVGLEASLLFSSGYAANVGMLGALLGRGDLVVSDALNHASIVDGCRLGRADVRIVPHLDVDAVERALAGASNARRRFVVTEAYFSMDGDVPDLVALRAACDRHGAALIVDEAHSLGVFGPEGGGLCRERGVVPDVLVGTLGKAVGSQGAFVAGPSSLRTWLWNRARSFVFSTGTSPWLAALVRRRLAEVVADDVGRARLARIVDVVRAELAAMGAPVPASRGPIVPWLVGQPAAALALRDRLLAEGVFVQAIRPPTVPVGTARLRLSLHAGLTDAEVAHLLRALRVTAAG